MNIEISKLRLLGYDNLKAVVSVVIDGKLAVHDIKIIETKNNKTIVAMPSKRDIWGVYHDVVHPITNELREQINDVVLSEYERLANCTSTPTQVKTVQ